MRKFKSNLILFFMTISLITVGFASWINVPTDDSLVEGGSLITDDVVMVLTNPKFDTTLKYNKYGFLTQYEFDEESGTLTTEMYDNITYSIDVNLSTCKEIYSDATGFQITIKLKDQTQYDYINKILDLVNVTISCNGATLNSNDIVSVVDNEIVVSFTILIGDINQNVSNVSVKYDFSGVSTSKVTDTDKQMISDFFNKLVTEIKDYEAFVISTSVNATYNLGE